MGTDIPAIVRTAVPLLVSWVVSILLSINVDVTPEQQVTLINGLGIALAAVYYVVVKHLEKRWPILGVLLGSTKQPVYVDPNKTLGEQRASVVTEAAFISKPPEYNEPESETGFLDATGVDYPETPPVSGNQSGSI